MVAETALNVAVIFCATVIVTVHGPVLAQEIPLPLQPLKV